MIKKGDKWIEVSMSEAINYAASNLERYRGNQFGMIGSAHQSIEENYILQKFTRIIMRSNNVDLFPTFTNKDLIKNIHDYYLANPPFEIDSFEDADTIFVIGSHAYISHPIIENRIRKAFKRGSEIIYANTYLNRTSNFSNQIILYNPGAVYYLLLVLITGLANKSSSIAANNIKQKLKNFEPHVALQQSGVSASTVKQVIKSFTSSKKIIIIAGDDLTQSPDSNYNFNALYNIHQLMNNTGICRIIFPLGEGNQHGGTLVGMHPDYLPGFDILSNKKNIQKWSDNWKIKLSQIAGMSADEMVNNIREDRITALYVAGDIPKHPNLKNLKFLIQQNMFLTETSEYAHVFFPISSFTETNGHIITLDRQIKEFKQVITPVEDVKSPLETLPLISEAMLEYGFDYNRSEDVYAEIESYIDLSFSSSKKGKLAVPLGKPKKSKRNVEYPIPVIIENNYFHYMGNQLSSLIPDMKAIVDEGILLLSYELAGSLKINNGDKVKILTEYGDAIQTVKLNSDMNGEKAYLKPKLEYMSFLGNGLNLHQRIIYAKIEKE
jgi:predicted molibdopterin-dependent oxidoreductase YjgC